MWIIVGLTVLFGLATAADADSGEEADVVLPVVLETKAPEFSDLVAITTTLTLSQVCEDDAKRLCRAKSVYDGNAIECLTKHLTELDPDCRTWHADRLTCTKQLSSQAHDCPTCSTACQNVASPLRCAISLGAPLLKEVMSEQCTATPYFSSLMRMAHMRTRRRRPPPPQRFG